MKNTDRIKQVETEIERQEEKLAENIKRIQKICEGCHLGTKHAGDIVENIRKLEVKHSQDMNEMKKKYDKEINKLRQNLPAMGKKIILIQIVMSRAISS